MFCVEVRDRMMIAHSLPDPWFGPAQGLHGATYVADVAFFRDKLNRHNTVVDIGAALRVLGEVLKPLAYQNLDTLPEFAGRLTTTEYLCKHIFDRVVEAAAAGALGEEGKDLSRIRVTLSESDVARASYEGMIRG
jgi:6-pyruvoyl-tetrahydropterin synthase